MLYCSPVVILATFPIPLLVAGRRKESVRFAVYRSVARDLSSIIDRLSSTAFPNGSETFMVRVE